MFAVFVRETSSLSVYAVTVGFECCLPIILALTGTMNQCDVLTGSLKHRSRQKLIYLADCSSLALNLHVWEYVQPCPIEPDHLVDLLIQPRRLLPAATQAAVRKTTTRSSAFVHICHSMAEECMTTKAGLRITVFCTPSIYIAVLKETNATNILWTPPRLTTQSLWTIQKFGPLAQERFCIYFRVYA